MYVNFLGQMTALLLFAYEYNERMDFTNLKLYSSTKQLRILIEQQIYDSYLVANDIIFEKNETCLTCKVQKRPR